MLSNRLRPFIPVAALILGTLAIALVIGQSTVTAAPDIDAPLAPQTRGSMGNTTGPDVTIIRLDSTRNWGSENGIRGYSISTDSCNIGSEPLNWCDDPPNCSQNGVTLQPEQHPVIAQNLYRLQDGRFEQIGMSWLKHGFLSLNTGDSNCVGTDANGNPFSGCITPPLGGSQLGVGCTDLYGTFLNGQRPMGRRSEVNAATGDFPFPVVDNGDRSEVYHQRIQVKESDLDDPNARFWIEGHYVADNDALAGNGLNNASHREVSVSSSFSLNPIGSTQRERAAIFAWRDADPSVEIMNADTSNAGITERFHVARTVTEVGVGTWHYEFAIHNMNSDQGARSFEVQFPGATSFSNVEFHDVEHHSGEPYSTADWALTTDPVTGLIRWSTDTFATDPNANALRWGTMFSFRFDANRPPEALLSFLGLFKVNGSIRIRFNDLGTITIFVDGFEKQTTNAWSATVP